MVGLRRELAVDFQTAEAAGLRGLSDNAVLALAAQDDRILVSHDRRTMSRFFARFIISDTSPGVIIVSQNLRVRVASDELPLIWTASEPEEWKNLIIDLQL